MNKTCENCNQIYDSDYLHNCVKNQIQLHYGHKYKITTETKHKNILLTIDNDILLRQPVIVPMKLREAKKMLQELQDKIWELE